MADPALNMLFSPHALLRADMKENVQALDPLLEVAELDVQHVPQALTRLAAIRKAADDLAELLRPRLAEPGPPVPSACDRPPVPGDRHAEDAQRSEQLLKTLIEVAPASFRVRDATGRYVLANHASGARLRAAQTEIVGRTPHELVAAGYMSLSEAEACERRARDARRHPGSRVDEDCLLNTPSGAQVLHHVTTLSLDKDPFAGWLLETETSLGEREKAEDDRARLERQLLGAQKMEALATLAAGVAHDFNDILGTVVGYAEVAALDFDERGIDCHALDEILKAASRAKELVRRILAFSRQDGERAHAPVKLNALVAEVADHLRLSLPTTVKLEAAISETPCVVMANAAQLKQVLMNLAANSVHALRQGGGTLSFELASCAGASRPLLDHPERPPSPLAILRVTDTGEGMTDATVARIFDPFFTTKARGEGTGLGLSVVHGVVRAHGGSIAVRSEPGRGTLFEIALPAEARAARRRCPTRRSLPTGDETILFVDDEAPLTKIGTRLLTRLGYTVIARTSSVEALEAFRCRSGEIKLLITDHTMPNMTGLELAKAALDLVPGLPIILATGYSEAFLHARAKELGIQFVALKPYLGRDLAFMVRRALDR